MDSPFKPYKPLGKHEDRCSRVGSLNDSAGCAVCAAKKESHTNNISTVSAQFGNQHLPQSSWNNQRKLMIDIERYST